MALGRKTGGRKKGTPNKATGAQEDLLNAWCSVGGYQRAMKLLKRAFEEAEGHEVIITKDTPAGREITTKHEYNFSPLIGLLPYIARKMPEKHEVSYFETMTPTEIHEKWKNRQDKYPE